MLSEFQITLKLFNYTLYHPTSLCRVQITPKTSTNITRYLYSRGPDRQVFSQRASDEFDSSYEKKFCLSMKSEINCASDGVVETTKTSLPCSPAVDQSVSWISRANSVPLRILLSRIPRKYISAKFACPHIKIWRVG